MAEWSNPVTRTAYTITSTQIHFGYINPLNTNYYYIGSVSGYGEEWRWVLCLAHHIFSIGRGKEKTMELAQLACQECMDRQIANLRMNNNGNYE